MEVEEFGTVIRVRDLNRCRIFYQRLLELDEPEINSTFLVRFRLAPKTVLYLEKCDAPYLEHASAASAFTFKVKELAAVKEFFKKENFCGELVEIQGSIGTFLRGQDPEGNVFYIGE
ncbi:MAG: hypothetical protein IJZ19_11450 [Lentisphaeria bacterium]|jgi:catechol 2,3-dioxygenase-like lactoylglutathione lyase family enzyme|nr:hypothetical protein [Lentisphaeria bacterium]MBQ8755637.1 hypothetical protein [Lentisphaeria bacterium]MBQ9776280.1 hypothetical protein [Lentisphaeria bacterium]